MIKVPIYCTIAKSLLVFSSWNGVWFSIQGLCALDMYAKEEFLSNGWQIVNGRTMAGLFKMHYGW